MLDTSTIYKNLLKDHLQEMPPPYRIIWWLKWLAYWKRFSPPQDQIVLGWIEKEFNIHRKWDIEDLEWLWDLI